MPEKYIRNPNTFCNICFKPVYKRPKEILKGRIYCSQACYGKSCTILKTCPVCNMTFPSGMNKNTCSRACSNIQRTGIQYKIGRPKDKSFTIKALKSRMIEIYGPNCQECGNENVNILQAHHIIARKDNGPDDMTNLKLLCPNCHNTIHLGNSRLEKLAEGSEHDPQSGYSPLPTDFQSVPAP